MKVICYIDEPSPIAYQDVYEEGDEWVKIQGCEACPLESRRQCCGNCKLFTEMGCYLHLKPVGCEKTASSDKFWDCIVKWYPSAAMSYCALEFKCVKGSMSGKIRRVRDPQGVFVEG